MSAVVFVLLLSLGLAGAFSAEDPLRNAPNGVEVHDSSSRRDFLNQAGIVTASALWHPHSSSAALTPAIDLPPMGLGAWAWGDPLFWGYSSKEDDELKRVFDYAVADSRTPKTLFDTAEIYGLGGRSETLLGKFRETSGDKVMIATKFAALPFRTKPNDVLDACKASIKRLGAEQIDLYQIHFPGAWSNAEYWDGLAMAYEQGLVKAVGVSNYGVDAIKACHKFLADRGIPLATNQIQFSLLYPWPNLNGLLQTCRDLDIQVLSYSPLALGFLTGKYNAENAPKGPRQAILKQLLSTPDYQNLLDAMKGIASNHHGASLSQVAINWTRAKGTVPIPGARTIRQVEQNYGALNWDLSREEEKELDNAASLVTTFLTPEKCPFPKEDINTGLKMFDS